MKRDAPHIPFVTSGSYPIRSGNAVRPLVDGAPAFNRICEAIESARHSVWLTVAFLTPDFEMPGGHGGLFDVLDRAEQRGLDVRVIFWRHTGLDQMSPDAHFPGNEAQRKDLTDRKTRVLMRWDQAHGRYCQHQKSWLVDAGHSSEVAFVGGINLQPNSVVEPGHTPREDGNTHDVYVEVRGPAASDVHHNFVQRWNEASDRAEADGCWPDASSQDDLAFPDRESRPAGDAVVQIQRTVRRDRYRNGHPVPGGRSFEIEAGELSIVDQYRQAIEAAQQTIYIEDQAIGSPEIVDRLHGALERGVDVTFLVPIDVNEEMAAGRNRPESKAFFDSLAALGDHDHFLLAGIVSQGSGAAAYHHVYVHAKIALIDDAWCTIGSANIGARSFYGDTELNASIWHAETVRALREELLLEHLDRHTGGLDDRAAFAQYREIARANALRRSRGERLEGMALALDPATYAS
jgi:phosphatidylserine/phosphatidylglycerophosphate/cardiolipin synthase-like enzyme